MHDGGGAATAVEHALDQLSTSLDHLVKLVEDGELSGHGDGGLVDVLQRFERIRNRLSLVDHQLVAEVVSRDLSERLAHGRPARFLASALRLSPAEASRRVRAAAALRSGHSPTGQPVPAPRPLLAAAQRTGEVSPEQVAIVEQALRSVDRPGFDPDAVEQGERLLTSFATTFGPRDLARLATQVVNAIDPDGTRPDDQVQSDRRHFELRATRDGAWVGEFRLTGVLGAKLRAVLSPLARPRAEAAAGMPSDERTYGQRLHDAVEDVCDRMLRSGDLPASGGVPATVIVTIDYEDLLTRSGYGITTDGCLLSARQVLALAEQAEIMPTVLTRSGAVLDMGRSRRIANASQTHALVARDGGCSFPGCERAPQLCERHHIRAWIDGGDTDVDNLTLLCRYHHHNFAERGWSCRMNADRMPEWLPPRWVDPEQRPQVHHRILAARAGRNHRRAHRS